MQDINLNRGAQRLF